MPWYAWLLLGALGGAALLFFGIWLYFAWDHLSIRRSHYRDLG